MLVKDCLIVDHKHDLGLVGLVRGSDDIHVVSAVVAHIRGVGGELFDVALAVEDDVGALVAIDVHGLAVLCLAEAWNGGNHRGG